MRRSILLLGVVLAPAFAWSAPPTDDGPAWGATKDGLASRLTLVTGTPVLGGPIQLKLEVKNVGDGPAAYDDQQAATNDALLVKGPDGSRVPYVGGSFQTMGQTTTLPSGESRTIFASLDVSVPYLIDRPGSYTIETRPRGGVPASNALSVTVGSGELGDARKLLGALVGTAPKGWRVADQFGSIVFLSSPTGLKDDATSISLTFTREAASPAKPPAGRPPVVDLGETTLGHAWLSAYDRAAVERWPDYAKVIGERVKAYAKRGG